LNQVLTGYLASKGSGFERGDLISGQQADCCG
jgi:hypothetical protein